MLVGPHEFDWQLNSFQIFRSKKKKMLYHHDIFLINASKIRVDIFYVNIYLNT